jgi:hypothetical protein
MKFPGLHHNKSEQAADAEKIKQAKPASETEDKRVIETENVQSPQPPTPLPEGKKNVKGLYVYCIVPSDSPKEYGKIGVKNGSLVYAITFKDVAAVVSNFEDESFEKIDANVLAHQRVVHKVFEEHLGVPVRFGTIRENEEDVRQTLEDGYPDFKKQLSGLTPTAGEASPIESGAPTDIIAEILSQSAASAVRIRGLSDSLDTVKREEYEKGAARLPEGTAKQLLDFLAKAPPGSYQTSNVSTASSDQMQVLEKRLDSLFEEIGHLKDMITTQGGPGIGQFQKDQNEIKEAVLGLRVLQDENKVSLEKAVSQAIKEQMSKTPPAKQLMLDTVGKEEPYPQPIAFNPGQPSNTPQSPMAFSPGQPFSTTQGVESYTRCQRCGAGLVITDRFCPHCGRPSYQSGT